MRFHNVGKLTVIDWTHFIGQKVSLHAFMVILKVGP
jgi:hypothetical protein